MSRFRLVLFVAVGALASNSLANEPVAMYAFPAGGQRGTTVEVRIGGLFFHGECDFQVLGPGIESPPRIRETETTWFEGPVIPLPASQRAEDYPKDHAATLKIAADAPIGVRYWRASTSQGATSLQKFVVGDLPEIIEQEIDGEPVPVPVTVPVTINGRIFPREDVDAWSVELKQGETIQAEVTSARLGYPLASRLFIVDDAGRTMSENNGHYGADAFLRFTAPRDGVYQVRIHDLQFAGLQHYVYRLSLTSGPYIDAVYPLGGRRGTDVALELAGHALSQRPYTLSLPADGPEAFAAGLKIENQTTNELVFELSDLPEVLESEPNDSLEAATAGSWPAVLNGRIQSAGDVDCWSLEASKGEVLQFDLRAARLGSPLDSVLVVLDAAGKELARSDDLSGEGTDSRLHFTPPANGTYRVRVEERFARRGGLRFAYRLHVAPASGPDFRLVLPTDAINLFRDGQVKLKLGVERLDGFNGPIELSFDNLPAAVTATPVTITAKQSVAQITFKAAADAKLVSATVRIRGSAEIDGQRLEREAAFTVPRGMPPLDGLYLSVGMPAPFKIVGVFNTVYVPRGSVYRRHYTVDRGGFSGPLTIKLADRQARHLQGVTGPVITVPVGATEFDYPVFLAPWLEIGRTSRTVIMAIGVVEDSDGTRHTVSHSTPAQNEQIIILTDPGLLSVAPERSSLAVVPGKASDLVVHVERSHDVHPG